MGSLRGGLCLHPARQLVAALLHNRHRVYTQCFVYLLIYYFYQKRDGVDDVTSERLSRHIKEWPLGGESEPGLAACKRDDGSERGEDSQNPSSILI